jgi:cytochrome bd-type quinol oxidase subunit 1
MEILELQGIKNLEIIEVNLLPYFLLFCIIFLLLLLLFILALFLFLKRKKKRKKKAFAKQYLRELFIKDLSDKEIAYAFTRYGRKTVQEEGEERFYKITEQLENFKYKKEVPTINSELQNEMREYIKAFV